MLEGQRLGASYLHRQTCRITAPSYQALYVERENEPGPETRTRCQSVTSLRLVSVVVLKR